MCDHFRKLRSAMFEVQVTQDELAKVIGRSTAYLSFRITGKMPFDMQDVYRICDYLELSYAEIANYFPKDGKEKGTGKRHDKVDVRSQEAPSRECI